MTYADKVLENRLRRKADRHGLRLIKSRRRDPDAHDFGLYALVTQDVGGTIHPEGAISPYDLDLDEVESWLSTPADGYSDNIRSLEKWIKDFRAIVPRASVKSVEHAIELLRKL